MSNFWDKPKEIDYGLSKQIKIPRPPKDLLDDKEYIVFHNSLGINQVSFFISSFGRFLGFGMQGPGWLDMSLDKKFSKAEREFKIIPASLCFINQGWVQLIETLNNDNNNRLALNFHGIGGNDTSSGTIGSFIEIIPKLLSLYTQFFPDAVITETNNDPDVFFRNKQINPGLSKTFDELREKLQSSDEVIPEWRTQARALTDQSIPEGKIKYDDFIKARESLRKIVKGGRKKRTKKKKKKKTKRTKRKRTK